MASTPTIATAIARTRPRTPRSECWRGSRSTAWRSIAKGRGAGEDSSRQRREPALVFVLLRVRPHCQPALWCQQHQAGHRRGVVRVNLVDPRTVRLLLTLQLLREGGVPLLPGFAAANVHDACRVVAAEIKVHVGPRSRCGALLVQKSQAFLDLLALVN